MTANESRMISAVGNDSLQHPSEFNFGNHVIVKPKSKKLIREEKKEEKKRQKEEIIKLMK